LVERRVERSEHSRAIGIHRPSLMILDQLGVAQRFVDRGVRVFGGTAEVDGRILGTLRFDESGGPFPFALSLPQSDSERLLDQVLEERAPQALRRGWEVTDVSISEGECVVQLRGPRGESETVRSQFVVGCDGERSVVRRAAGIPFEGEAYPDSFVMGDFDDNTPYGSEARLFLAREGLVESFPLPGQARRWVVATKVPIERPEQSGFASLVRQRTGHDLREQRCTMLSTFGIKRRLARSMVWGPIALAGDAAHVVSPIGGQGLNAGWMDARDLSEALELALRPGTDRGEELARYERRALKRARTVMRRASFNTYLGRATRLDPARNGMIRLALRSPLRQRLARAFSMQGL